MHLNSMLTQKNYSIFFEKRANILRCPNSIEASQFSETMRTLDLKVIIQSASTAVPIDSVLANHYCRFGTSECHEELRNEKDIKNLEDIDWSGPDSGFDMLANSGRK